MVGKLRGQLDRVIAVRGPWVGCSLLLVATFLAGCNSNRATSTTGSPASAVTSANSVTSSSSTSSSTSTSGSTAPQTVSSSSAPADNKSVDVSWVAPTANTDGSALTDLAGYTIYYGTSPSALSQSVNVPSAGATDYVVQGLTQGTWYFVVTAYTNTGLQSGYSSVVSKSVT